MLKQAMTNDDVFHSALAALGIGGAGLLWYYNRKKSKELVKLMDTYRKANPLTPGDINKLRGSVKTPVQIRLLSDKAPLAKDLNHNAMYVPNDGLIYPAIKQQLAGKNSAQLGKKSPDKYGMVVLSDSTKAPAILAHELGHASNNKEGKQPSAWTNLAIMGGGALGSIALGSLLRDKWDYDTGLAGLGRRLLTLSPVMLGAGITGYRTYKEEARASENAYNYLKNLSRSKKQSRQDTKMLENALDSYKRSAVSSVLSPVMYGTALYGLSRLLFPGTAKQKKQEVTV